MHKKGVIFEKKAYSTNIPILIVPNKTNPYLEDMENFVYVHWHNELEIMYITEGSAIFHTNSQQITACAGQAVMINGGEIHAGYSIKGIHCSLHAIIFSPEMLGSNVEDTCYNNYIEPFVQHKYKLPALISGKEKWEKEILKLFPSIIDIYESKPLGYELKIKSLFLNLYFEIISNKKYEIVKEEKSIKKNRKTVEIKKVLTYIQENYSHKLYVQELAALIGMSPDNFYKFFKNYAQCTPVEYINYYRIEEAVRLLSDKSLTVLDIALSVGYENVSYFIKTFKKYKRCTPDAYRYKNI